MFTLLCIAFFVYFIIELAIVASWNKDNSNVEKLIRRNKKRQEDIRDYI